MNFLLIAMGVMILGGLAALATSRSGKLSAGFGAGGAVIGCAIGLFAAATILTGGRSEQLRLPWSIPGGSFFVQADALSAFFLIPTFLLSALAAIYGAEHLRTSAKRQGISWFCYNLLIASMALVLVAHNGVLFLVAWETMALASFFLVATENERPEVREASWTYLIATHIGTAFLLVMFLLLAKQSGSFDFDTFGGAAAMGSGLAGLIFVLAVIGFGTKAGFMPLHVWLPEAHPAAPSHVSAVMSGVMIKTGIYGLVRTITFLGPPPAWWGFALVVIGITSGILGVLFALAQHDIKRLLAYHSVENIGIIALGLGVGLLGVSYSMPALIVLGFGGGLLHVLNHALFKGLLFLGAGSVLHGTGTREIDRLGGLLKRMPWTGVAFLVGATAISGLPPLNGFVSEFLIYLGAFKTTADPHATARVITIALAVIASLALIGGLALTCFTKAFGIIFLGEPRSDHAAHAHESGPAMWLPMLTLAGACVLIGLCPAPILALMSPVIEIASGQHALGFGSALEGVADILWMITLVAVSLLAVIAALALLRARLLAGRKIEQTVTWDCGYAQPTPRMQYTASSFVQPLIAMFSAFLRTRSHRGSVEGIFPTSGRIATHTPDVMRESIFRPIFGAVESALSRLRSFQHGRIQLYVFYVVLALIVLLVWKLR